MTVGWECNVLECPVMCWLIRKKYTEEYQVGLASLVDWLRVLCNSWMYLMVRFSVVTLLERFDRALCGRSSSSSSSHEGHLCRCFGLVFV